MEQLQIDSNIKWPSSWLGFKLIDQATVDSKAAMVLPSDKAIAGKVRIMIQSESSGLLNIYGTVVAIKFTYGKVYYSLAVRISPQPKEGMTLYAVIDDVPSELVGGADGDIDQSSVLDSIDEDVAGKVQFQPMTREQKIDHIVLNVPNMAKFSYTMYFGKPDGDRFTIQQLQEHARRNLESDFLDLDVLYGDVEGNDELVDPLPEINQANVALKAALDYAGTIEFEAPALDSASSPIERLKLVGQLVRAKWSLPAADGPLSRLKLVGEINRIRAQLGGTAMGTVTLETEELSDDPNSPNYRYRDTGEIAGSRKELAAANIRSWARDGKRVDQTDIDWESLEENPREAKDLITKSNLFGSVDWSGLRDSGMEPGAGFLVDRIYAAIGTEPSEDSPQARRDYTLGLQSLRDRLESCTTVVKVMAILDEMRDELRGTMFKPEDADKTAELRARLYAISAEVGALREVSDQLYNIAQRARGQVYGAEHEVGKRKRRNWAPKPELDQALADAKVIADEAWEVWSQKLAEQKPIIDALDAERRELIKQIRAIEQATIARNLVENPATRAWATMGSRFLGVLNYRSDKGSDAFRRHVVAAKQGKVGDWSWAENEVAQAAPKVSKKTVRFQLKVIDNYERVGGRTIAADSTAALKASFGLREVQSGNWVLKDPVSARFHVESSAAAFADLADLLGVDDAKVSMNGRLAMAFGARGRGNAGFGGAPRAHYEPVHRVMNLTKMGGGGCLAHEWFHGLDNMISEAVTGQPGGKQDFVTTNPALLPEGALRDAIVGLRLAMFDGEHKATEVIEYTAGDYKLAQHNLADDFVKAPIRLAIKNASDVHAAVQAIDDYFAGKTRPKDKKLARDWRRIAVAWHGGSETGGSIGVKAGPSMSSFAIEAARLDPGDNPYWSKPEEMAARAFQSWCEDRLSGQGRRNDYLSAMADNKHYFDPLFGQMNPYPDGEERERINAAFDKLFAAMKAGKTLDSVAEMLDSAT